MEISVEKLGDGVSDGTRSVLVRAVTGNTAHFLLGNDSWISSADISFHGHHFFKTLLKTQSLKSYTKLSERVKQGNVKLLC